MAATVNFLPKTLYKLDCILSFEFSNNKLCFEYVIYGYVMPRIYNILCLYVASIVAVSAVAPRSPTSGAKLFHTLENLISSVCISIYESDLFFCYVSSTNLTLFFLQTKTFHIYKFNSTSWLFFFLTTFVLFWRRFNWVCISRKNFDISLKPIWKW